MRSRGRSREGLIDLGHLGGTYAAATAVNSSGQVVGESNTGTAYNHAFSWTASGSMVNLGTLGREQRTRVNDAGQVVGWSEAPDLEPHAFSWTRAGGMVDLGTLGGGRFSLAFDVNEAGQVVGSSATPSGGRAFSWTPGGGMVNLGTLGGTSAGQRP